MESEQLTHVPSGHMFNKFTVHLAKTKTRSTLMS